MGTRECASCSWTCVWSKVVLRAVCGCACMPWAQAGPALGLRSASKSNDTKVFTLAVRHYGTTRFSRALCLYYPLYLSLSLCSQKNIHSALYERKKKTNKLLLPPPPRKLRGLCTVTLGRCESGAVCCLPNSCLVFSLVPASSWMAFAPAVLSQRASCTYHTPGSSNRSAQRKRALHGVRPGEQ